MSKGKRGRAWLWLLLIVILVGLAGFGYYRYKKGGPKKEELVVGKELAQAEKEGLSNESKGVMTFPVEDKSVSHLQLNGTIGREGDQDASVEEDFAKKAVLDKGACARIEQHVAEFFQSLDTKRYDKQSGMATDTYTRFKEMLRRLETNAPLPAGEGTNPQIMVKNIYFFCRALDLSDICLIKEVIRNEQDTMEINLEMFYEWLMLGSRCPNPGGLRPSLDVLYRYAGFFLNTIGGRAYLFRRSVGLRLLVGYYCLLIVNETDRLEKNSYGIDILPYIKSLREEISNYPDFEFRRQYIERLDRLETYYLQKRR